MEAFATTYVRTAIDDPRVSWAQLTKAYQTASGGFGKYRQFWDQWESAGVTKVSADASAGTVSYSIRYEGEEAARASTTT